MSRWKVGPVVLLVACSRPSPPPLSAADELRAAAVLEARLTAPRRPICLAVDPRVLGGIEPPASTPCAEECDPSVPLLATLSREKAVYPSSKCVEKREGPASGVTSPEAGDESAVLVTVGAIQFGANGESAQVEVGTWSGELTSRWHRLSYQKTGSSWQLKDRRLILEE